MASATSQNMKPSDRAYGYAFGCDGFVTREQAAEHLAVSLATIDRLLTSGKLRKGKSGDHKQSAVRVCRRSLLEFSASLEE